VEASPLKDALAAADDNPAGPRLHVCSGPSCNNNCLFCMEEDREARFRRVSGQTDADVERMLRADPGVREVMFTSGEPTLNPRLPRYLRLGRDLGFGTVGLITNGRRLAYLPYARSLVEAGLNHVLVSIHGPTARVHDALTRTPGAFDQACAGLANLAALKREHEVKVHTSFVVTTRNLGTLREFVDALRPFAIDQHVFNVMMPQGRGLAFFDTLMPGYAQVSDAFLAFVDGLEPGDRDRVFLLDVPFCVTEALPDRVRGYVERYHHFEPDSPDSASYARVTKSGHDAEVRVFRPECSGCAYRRACRGVFRAYVERRGWDEFVPVPWRGVPG
jgi:cyclic pyranopterin phosphate synthase